MTDEKEIINPQAEGSNAASGSSSFRTEIEEEVDSGEDILFSDYDSDNSEKYLNDIDNEYLKLLDEKDQKEIKLFCLINE